LTPNLFSQQLDINAVRWFTSRTSCRQIIAVEQNCFVGENAMVQASITESGRQPQLTPSDWITFRDRVAEAASIARAAMTNVVTALSSITVAIVGTAVTVATAEFHTNPFARAMLCAIAGAGLSALAILIALTVEAIRATKCATRWHASYVEIYQRALGDQPFSAVPWSELRSARLSVSVHWKVSLPVVLFLAGLLAMVVAITWDAVKPPH
jgi:hypothetical protein